MLVDPVGLVLVCAICAGIGFALGWCGGALDAIQRRREFDAQQRACGVDVPLAPDNRTRPLTDQSQPWTPEHCKAYPRRASEEIEYLRGQLAARGLPLVPPLDYREWKRRYAARLMHHGWNERAAIKEAEYVWAAMEGVEDIPTPEDAADQATADARKEDAPAGVKACQPTGWLIYTHQRIDPHYWHGPTFDGDEWNGYPIKRKAPVYEGAPAAEPDHWPFASATDADDAHGVDVPLAPSTKGGA